MVYEKVPHYDRDYLLKVRDMAREIFSDDRMHVDAGQASKVSNPLFESYEFARRPVRRSRPGAGYRLRRRLWLPHHGRPCRRRCWAWTSTRPLIAANQQNNAAANISL